MQGLCISCAWYAGVTVASQEESSIFSNVVHGHHIYKAIWTPMLGERLTVLPEMGNGHEKHAVSARKGGEIVNHIPRQLSQSVWHFFAQ